MSYTLIPLDENRKWNPGWPMMGSLSRALLEYYSYIETTKVELCDGRIVPAMFRGAQQSVIVYLGDKAFFHCPSCPSTVPCAKHLYLDLCSSTCTYQKQNTKIKIGRIYTALATIWRLCRFSAKKKTRKRTKMLPFWNHQFVGEEWSLLPWQTVRRRPHL